MNVLIAGGGIAGLGAAIALRQAGHQVEVLERAPSPSEVGAGLAIWPNGSRALAALGVDGVPGCAVRRLELRNVHDRLLTTGPLERLMSRYGYELIILHRADLQAALLDRLGKSSVRFGSELARFEQRQSRVRASLLGGDELEADLLVGADGVRSAVRRQLLDDGEPRYSGATCWRGVAPFVLEHGTALTGGAQAASSASFRSPREGPTGLACRTVRRARQTPAAGARQTYWRRSRRGPR